MAVFTKVSAREAQQWLTGYSLGELVRLEGIASGIENTNYFLDTTQGRYVLTLFERLRADQLPFYLGMMQHLAQEGVACPAPLANREGVTLGELNGKPASIVTRLNGKPHMAPNADHCAQVGSLLAQMHHAALSYKPQLRNQRGLHWWQEVTPKIMPFLSVDQQALLQDELHAQIKFAQTPGYAALTISAVHADLFRDNVLFDGDTLGGAIDFYFAGTDRQLFDLAVTCNDWCVEDASGAMSIERKDALLKAYQSHNGQSPDAHAWPLMLRAAALRFWLSRLFDFHLPRPAEMVTAKDPGHFERVLRARREGH